MWHTSRPHRYAEQQTRQGSSDTRVPIRRPAIRWLYTVEAEKPIQISGSPERVEPMVQAATPLRRWSVFICDVSKLQREKARMDDINNHFLCVVTLCA